MTCDCHGAKQQGDVNGAETQPIWKYLKENAEEPVKEIDWVCIWLSVEISADEQNFSKFLVKDGKIRWFPARTTKVVCPLRLRGIQS